MTARRMSPEGRRLLIELESSRADVYADVAGFLTTGVGHMLTKDELSSGKILIDGESIRYGNLADDQIDALLQQDLRVFESAVNATVIPEIRQSRFDALVSLAFNIGSGAFARSTLLKRINARRFDEVPRQFRRWVFAGGRTQDGLVTRREKEIAAWNA